MAAIRTQDEMLYLPSYVRLMCHSLGRSVVLAVIGALAARKTLAASDCDGLGIPSTLLLVR